MEKALVLKRCECATREVCKNLGQVVFSTFAMISDNVLFCEVTFKGVIDANASVREGYYLGYYLQDHSDFVLTLGQACARAIITNCDCSRFKEILFTFRDAKESASWAKIGFNTEGVLVH